MKHNDPTPQSLVTRRHFCRSVALPASVLLVGGALPAWAAPNKKSKHKTGESNPADSTKTPCETKILWEFDGCIETRFMQRVTTCVYNGNVYLWILLPGLKTTIVKVPLAGGAAQVFPLMPGHVTGDDFHRYYTIGADSLGYIHVVGDMHSSPNVKHWISKRPEDISEFVYTFDDGKEKRPQGVNVTYPHLFRSPDGVLYNSIRCGDPVWGIGISKLDAKTQTWTMLGADVPSNEISDSKRAKKTKGKPMTAWEDNGEGGDFGYTQPHAEICWDKNKRMHIAFALLNEPVLHNSSRHTHTHVLYAYSDDGGTTLRRGDGSEIQLPMRAEAGPHQADVVYTEHEGPPPWLGVSAGLKIDSANRPVVSCRSYKTGPHSFVLENGKWIELARNPNSTASDQHAKPRDDDDDENEGVTDSIPALPYQPHRVNTAYLRETGDYVYTVFPKNGKFNRILLVLSKPIKTPEAK